MAESFDPSELFDAFRMDAEEQLRAFTARLAALRAGPGDDEGWRELYRAAHTVKGGGALLGLHPVAELAEAMCRAIRRQRAQPATSQEFWQALSEAGTVLDQTVRAATAGEATDPEQVRPYLERLAATT